MSVGPDSNGKLKCFGRCVSLELDLNCIAHIHRFRPVELDSKFQVESLVHRSSFALEPTCNSKGFVQMPVSRAELQPSSRMLRQLQLLRTGTHLHSKVLCCCRSVELDSDLRVEGWVRRVS